MKSKFLFLLSSLSLASCSSIDNKPNGNALGEGAGGVIGAQFGAGIGELFMTAIGAGVVFGGEITDEISGEKLRNICDELVFEKNTPKFQNCLDKLK